MPTAAQVADFLEEKNSLRLGESPWDPGDLSGTHDFWQVDWDRLFGGRPRRVELPWELDGDKWNLEDRELVDVVLRPFDEGHEQVSGGEDAWDVCAWYQPIHFHGLEWGIYVREECIYQLASRLAGSLAAVSYRARYTLGRNSRTQLCKALLRTAFALYFRHEYFHFKTECLGIRLHVVENKSSYVPYFRLVYEAVKGTDDQLEEALAGAYMYWAIAGSGYNGWIPKTLYTAAQAYLGASFACSPPGYRMAAGYLGREEFSSAQNQLMARVHEANLNPARAAREWGLAPRLSHAFLNINSEIWTVVPKGARPLLPTTSLPVRTCSTWQLVSICAKSGYEVVPGGKGSHVKMRKPGGRTVIIPGNRENLSPGVAKNVLEVLGYSIHDIPTLLND